MTEGTLFYFVVVEWGLSLSCSRFDPRSRWSTEAVATGSSRYNEHSAVAMRPRPKGEFTRFLDGLELVPPAYPRRGPDVVPVNQ